MTAGELHSGFFAPAPHESRGIVDCGGIFGGLGNVEENFPKNRLLGDSTQFDARQEVAHNMTKAQVIPRR
jgi:hypothetical protein